MATLGGQNQGTRSIRQGVIDIGAGREQEPHRLGIPGTGPKQQRRASTPQHGVVQFFAARPLRRLARHDLGVCARAGADIGPGLEQQANRLRMLLGGRPHDRRLIVLRFLRIDRRAGGN